MLNPADTSWRYLYTNRDEHSRLYRARQMIELTASINRCISYNLGADNLARIVSHYEWRCSDHWRVERGRESRIPRVEPNEVEGQFHETG